MIASFLRRPTFANEAKTRAAGLLHFIILLTLVVDVVAGVGMLWASDLGLSGLVVNLIGALAMIFLLVLLRRGHVTMVGVLLSAAYWLAITGMVVGDSGILNPVFSGYVMVIFLAGFVISERAAILYAVLSCLTGMVLVYAAEHGNYVTQLGNSPVRIAWIDYTIVFLLVTIFLVIGLRLLRQSIDRTALSEARYRTLIDHAPSTILTVDRQHRIQLINRTLFGLSADMIGRKLDEFTPAEARDEMRTKLERVFSAGTTEETEVFAVDQQGKPAWYVSHFAPIRDGESINEAIILVSDMTERKEAEAELRRSEELFATIFHSVPVALSITRLSDGQVISVNDFLLKLTGYEREALVGKHNLRVPIWLDRTQRQLAARLSLQPEGFDGVEFQLRARNGAIVNVMGSARQVVIGGNLCVIGMAVDMSGRKEAEEALRRSEALLSKVFQSAPVAIAITTQAEGRILTMNPYQLELLGYENFEVLNRTANELGFWADLSQRDMIVAAVRKKGYSQGVEGQWRTRSGDIRDMLVSFESIEIEGQACFLAMGIDITERKRVDEARLEAEKLRFELEKEREVLMLKDRFISTMSHEFRTPLAVIMAAKESLQYYYPRMRQERRDEHFANIEAQIQHLTHLLDEILTISRARAGKMVFQPTALNFTTYCQKLLEQIEMMDRGEHTFVFTSDGVPESVQADTTLLQHMLVNLLSNAVKYSPAGSEIRFGLKAADDEIVVQISDHGVGIPPEDQKHLFQPFYRASNTRAIQGTGLGLAIVQESVYAHGGSVTCESEVDKGTTFTVRLPLAVKES